MFTKYFLIINGQQVGPISINELRDAGMTGDTPVWREGLSDWVMASTLPELSEVLNGAQPQQDRFGGEGQPPHPAQENHGQYGQQGAYGQQGPQTRPGPQPQQGYYGPQGQYGPQNPQGAYGQYGQQNRYGQPYNQGQYGPYGPQQFEGNGLPVAHTNWMPWAIVGTVLGFLCCMIGCIFGIIAIVNANNANKYYDSGNVMPGAEANSRAKTNCIISLVLGGLGLLICIAVIGNGLLTNFI